MRRWATQYAAGVVFAVAFLGVAMALGAWPAVRWSGRILLGLVFGWPVVAAMLGMLGIFLGVFTLGEDPILFSIERGGEYYRWLLGMHHGGVWGLVLGCAVGLALEATIFR